MRWEDLTIKDDAMHTQRCRVPGGWLVRSVCYGTETDANGNPRTIETAAAMAFVPDYVPPGHITADTW